jgi:transcriptional accessory protein Tex/SPT6
MLIGKIIGLIVFGAILTVPVGVMLGMLAAPFKVRDTVVFAVAVQLSFFIAWSSIFGVSPPPTAEQAEATIKNLEREIAGMRADMHESRETCRTLAIGLSAEPQEFRNKMFSDCMGPVLDAEKITLSVIADINKRIMSLREPAPK